MTGLILYYDHIEYFHDSNILDNEYNKTEIICIIKNKDLPSFTSIKELESFIEKLKKNYKKNK